MHRNNQYGSGFQSSPSGFGNMMNNSGNSAAASAPASKLNRNKNKMMALLAVQAMAAASYFLLASPSDENDQHRSLAGESSSSASSGSVYSWSEWPTWGPVQNTFRRLCTEDQRTASYRRSLSLAAVENLIPSFVMNYMGGTKNNRFNRFLACNVGFNCTYDDITGYDECYDGTNIADPYETYIKDIVNIPVGGDYNIGYVVSIPECPDDANSVGDPLIDNNVFYDTYAVCLTGTCDISIQSEAINGGPPDTKYDYTMYAILHPDAVVCTSPSGAQIDHVSLLKDLGYHVKIYDEAIKDVELNDPYVKNNLENDVGFNDLVTLHAYRLTNHPLVMLVEPTTMMLQPIDEVFDALIADPNAKASYVKDSDNLVDMGSMIIKPSLEEFTAIKDTYINTAYTPAGGWGGSSIGAGGAGSGNMGSKGFLTYYYEGSPSAPPATEIDKCTYGNDMSAACKTKTIDQVKIAKLDSPDCPPSWKCDDKGEENQLCKDFHSEWSTKRKNFEDLKWSLTPFASRKGTFDTSSFKGYCNTKGKDGYNKMLDWNGEPEANADGVSYIPQEIYQDEVLIGCGVMDCGANSYVTPDCTCTSDPCDACPEGTRCQNEPGYPIMCIDCTCGFCDYDDRPCCDFNGVNNCKAASARKECKMQNDFFAPFPDTGNVCSGVEISYTATPNGCGCQPNNLTPCTYDPNDRSKADACSICTAKDLAPADENSPSVNSVKDPACSTCKTCLAACPFDPQVKKPTEGCIADAKDLHDLEACFDDLLGSCRAACHDDCRK